MAFAMDLGRYSDLEWHSGSDGEHEGPGVVQGPVLVSFHLGSGEYSCSSSDCLWGFKVTCPSSARGSLQQPEWAAVSNRSTFTRASLGDLEVKSPPAMQETRVRSLGREDALEKEMAAQSSILAWEIPCTEEFGGLQSVESQRVG